VALEKVALPILRLRASDSSADADDTETPALDGPLILRGLSVVLPAHNEEAVIADTVRRCVEVLSVVAPDYEIIIVDDGSQDRTGEIADELSAFNPRIRVVHNNPNRGYGGALIAGFQAASKQLTFFMDSDGQFDIADIATLLRYRAEGYRAVLGYRKHRQDAFMRLVNAWGWKMLVRALLGLHVRDIDCAFKLYDTSLVRTFDVRSSGAMINSEMLTKLMKLGIPFIEVPVHHLPRRHGKATGAQLRVIARAFKELLQLQRTLRSWSAHLVWDPSEWDAARSYRLLAGAGSALESREGRRGQAPGLSLAQRLALYLPAGGIAAAVNLSIFHLLYDVLPVGLGVGLGETDVVQGALRFLVAFVTGTELSILANYLLNDTLTFRHLPGHQRSWIARCIRFHLTCAVGTVLTFVISGALILSSAATALAASLTSLVEGMVNLLPVAAVLAQAVAIAVVTAFNFAAHHVFTYRQIRGRGERG
jgi:putative flippase GtrA